MIDFYKYRLPDLGVLYYTSTGEVKEKVKGSKLFFYKAKGVGMNVMMKMIKAMRPRVFLL